MAYIKKNPEALKPLQIEIKTQDQWDELLSKEGLILVDTYSAWCGPCKAIVSSFKRLKNELGDDLLVFATAETDSIETLEAYRMKSQPTFLFYAGGILVNVVRGCNCPLLIKTIRNELDREHKVMDGKADRVPFVDQEAMKEPDFEEKQDEEKDVEEEEEEIVELPKQVTVAIIKPDAVKAGLVDEIIQKVEESGMEVLRKEEKIISKEEAAEFYKQHEGSEHFDQLVEFMSSGPCMTLVLSKADEPLDADAAAGTIDYFRDLIGPKDVNIAKEEAPHSLRALYGTDTVMNAVHGCDSSESAARELAFFYPDFVAPTITKKRKKRQLQRTLALIRPDALRTRKESIINKIQEAGFTIAMSKEITLSKEQAESFYSQHKDSEFFETLVTNMTSGPMMALCLAREDAVEGWRGLLGPKEVTVGDEQAPDSLRSQFHVEESPVNPLHGSDSVENAEKEIQQFFPLQSTVAVIKPDLEPDKREDIMQRIKEAGFKIQYEKEVTLDKELASQLYHEHEGKDFFQGLTDHMSSGPTLFMVLTREDAVSGWRALMGPTDPQEALEIAPDSLRAQFGLDMMKNAVHGSSNVEKAEEAIKEFFPEVEILPDGSVKVPEEEELIEQGKAEEKDEIKEVEQPKETYSEPLGMESGIIPDEAIKASSVLDDQHDASKARLKTKPEGEQVGAWVPLESDENQWLQVDLGKVTRVTKIASQGESGESVRRVKGFSLSYNLTEEEFVPYSEDGAVKVFEGNSDQDTIVYSELRHPVIAQYVRLNPKEWSEGIALRTEFYGCDAETYSAPLGMESGTIPDEAIKASSVLDDQHNASKARLKTKPEGEQVGAWVPLESDENQWLQVDLGKVVEVAKVATQGSGDNSEHRVGSYTLLFSQDGEQFQSYGKDGEPKVFEGNSDGVSIVGHWLVEPFSARYCRLQPKTWNEQIALRVELFGKAPEEREAKDEAPSSQQVTSEEIVEKATEKEDDKQEELQAAKEGEVKSDEQEVSEKSDETDKTPQVEAERAETNPEVGEKEAEENKPEEAGESQVNEKEDSAVNKEVEESSVKPSGDDTADVSKPEGNEAVNASKPEGDEANVDASKPEGDGGEENKTTEGEGGQEEDSTVK